MPRAPANRPGRATGRNESAEIEKLASRYLAFLGYAFNPGKRKVQKFSYLRTQMDGGRGLRRLSWAHAVALGTVWHALKIRRCEGRRDVFSRLPSPQYWPSAARVLAFALLGIQSTSTPSSDRDAQQMRSVLAIGCSSSTVRTSLRSGTGSKMFWLFECQTATSGFDAGRRSADSVMVSAALGALNWLSE